MRRETPLSPLTLCFASSVPLSQGRGDRLVGVLRAVGGLKIGSGWQISFPVPDNRMAMQRGENPFLIPVMRGILSRIGFGIKPGPAD